MSKRGKSKDRSLAIDMLDGAKQIADFIGVSEARAFYLCERALVPAFKLGNRWCARKTELLAALTSRAPSVNDKQEIA